MNILHRVYQIFFIICFWLLATAALAESKQLASQSEQPIDLTKYAGKWYEIASAPTIFQRGCRCTTAEYTLVDNYLSIKNSCLKKENKKIVSSAKAYVVTGTKNSQFKLQFHKPTTHDYWIYYVDSDYQQAIVGTPDKKHIWILSREPSLSEEQYQALIKLAIQQGFSTKSLNRTNQSCF